MGRRLAALPGVVEGTRYGNRSWSVGRRTVAWERPLSKADVRRLAGAPVPQGELLAVSTADLSDKEAVLAAAHPGVLDLEHFRGFPAVLVQLEAVPPDVLDALLRDAWEAAGGRPTQEDQPAAEDQPPED